MAFKLTKQESKRRDALRDKIAEARIELEEVIGDQVNAIEAAYAAINDAIEKYNEVAQEAYNFFDDIHSDRESEFDDKSESWQEGDRGQAASAWVEEIYDLRDSLEDIEEVSFDGFTLEIPDHADLIDNLSSEAEY